LIKKIKMIIEACVETLEEAVQAGQNGATQIELCSSLEHGGLTPGMILVRSVLEHLNIPVKVMIRPRAGNFVYSEEEIGIMSQTIDMMRQEAVAGVVLGILKVSGEVDVEQNQRLILQAGDLPVTFHRAIDVTPDPLDAVRQVKETGASYILTSGQSETALEGSVTIRKMIKAAGPDLTIIVAGGVTSENLPRVKDKTAARAFHGRKIVDL
jgi:copper homeostasis protein